MKILSLETSAKICSLALLESEKILVESNLNLGLRHSELLFSLLDQTLGKAGWQIQDLRGLVVDKGPGSFTGIRIGITVARTLAQTLKVPLVGVVSLDVLARSVPPEKFYLSPMLDALGKEIYTSLYAYQKNTWKRLSPYRLIGIDEWLEYLSVLKKDILLLGEASQIYQKKIKSKFGQSAFFSSNLFPTAGAGGLLGRAKLAYRKNSPLKVLPFYLRPSYAETNYQKCRLESLKKF